MKLRDINEEMLFKKLNDYYLQLKKLIEHESATDSTSIIAEVAPLLRGDEFPDWSGLSTQDQFTLLGLFHGLDTCTSNDTIYVSKDGLAFWDIKADWKCVWVNTFVDDASEILDTHFAFEVAEAYPGFRSNVIHKYISSTSVGTQRIGTYDDVTYFTLPHTSSLTPANSIYSAIDRLVSYYWLSAGSNEAPKTIIIPHYVNVNEQVFLAAVKAAFDDVPVTVYIV